MSKFLISRVLSAVFAAGAALHLTLPVAMGDGALAKLRGGSMLCCIVCAMNVYECGEICGGSPWDYLQIEHEWSAWGDEIYIVLPVTYFCTGAVTCPVFEWVNEGVCNPH